MDNQYVVKPANGMQSKDGTIIFQFPDGCSFTLTSDGSVDINIKDKKLTVTCSHHKEIVIQYQEK